MNINTEKLLQEAYKQVQEANFSLDRHGSLPNRPNDARFKTPEEYNDHMGFDAALTGDEKYTPQQLAAVDSLIKQGYKVTGHSKEIDNTTTILLAHHKRGTTRYAEVHTDGKIC